MADPLLGRDLALDYLLGAFREDADFKANCAYAKALWLSGTT